MEARFEARKREIAKDVKIDKAAVAGATSRLVRFLGPYFKPLSRNETRENATTFTRGLLSDLGRKNTESIAYRFGQDRRGLQRFLGEVAWDDKTMRNRLAKQAAKWIGEEDGVPCFSMGHVFSKTQANNASELTQRRGSVDQNRLRRAERF